MKRFVCAAAAAIGLLSAGSAGAVPIFVNGTGVLTDLTVQVTGKPTTNTSVSIPIAFSIVYDTTGTLPLVPQFGENGGYGGYFTIAASGLVDSLAGTREGTPQILSTATSYGVFNQTIGYGIGITLNIAAPVSATQGLISFLPGSTIGIGSFTKFVSKDYSGYITAVSTSTGVPEVATWAMMMVGLGVVGGALRTRRRALAIAYVTGTGSATGLA